MRKKYNRYHLTKDYVVGYTNNTNQEFYIDYCDFPLVCQFTWNTQNTGYITANKNHTKIYLHRLILNVSEKINCVDHINHKRFDNRRCNLRIVSDSQNQMNRPEPQSNTTGTKGVYWHKRLQKWTAAIQINKKLLHLGVFEDKNEAIKARKIAEKRIFWRLQQLY